MLAEGLCLYLLAVGMMGQRAQCLGSAFPKSTKRAMPVMAGV
jgi:hypothetical protein